MYKYNYVLRFNAIKGSFDGTEKHVQTYRLEFLVEQIDTGYSRTEGYLRAILDMYKNQDLDEIKGKHFTLEDMAKEIYKIASKSDFFVLKKLEVSNSLINTYILEESSG